MEAFYRARITGFSRPCSATARATNSFLTPLTFCHSKRVNCARRPNV